MKSYSFNIRGKILEINTPRVMGILNVTPDSFFDGGKFMEEKAIVQQAAKLLSEGADMLDIGGMSSRPGAADIPEEVELQRVLAAIIPVHKEFPDALLSVDTIRSRVAEAAIQHGAVMVNDISAGRFDTAMFAVAANYDCPMILMHMKGTPQTMQHDPHYENILTEIVDFFEERIAAATGAGVKDLVLDPGFGFGKSMEHNYKLLKNIHIFNLLNFPVLAGLSRKRMIANVLGVTPAEALNGTIAANILALQGGAQLLRVHDVKEAVEAVKIWNAYNLA